MKYEAIMKEAFEAGASAYMSKDPIVRDSQEKSLQSAYKKWRKKNAPCVFFRSYHSDEDSWYTEVSEEEYKILLQNEDALRNGNWITLIDGLIDRPETIRPNLARCVEIATC